MFDLTDDVENSPYSTKKAKPTEVNPIPVIVKEKPIEKAKPQPKNDDYNEYEYSDDKEADDTQW